MKLGISVLLLLCSLVTFASEKATIQQMKGKKAILRFDDDIPFMMGQQVYVNSGEGGELGVLVGQRNLMERKNSINFGAEISNLSTKAKGASSSTTSKVMSTNVRYGWNMKQYEYGVIGGLSLTETGSLKVTTLEVGGFYEYNLVPNIIGQELVYGPYGQVTFGSTDNRSTKTSPMTVEGGGFMKWFILSPVLAFRVDAAIQYVKDAKYTAQGFGLSAGFNHYF